jgi:hypothetical protein
MPEAFLGEVATRGGSGITSLKQSCPFNLVKMMEKVKNRLVRISSSPLSLVGKEAGKGSLFIFAAATSARVSKVGLRLPCDFRSSFAQHLQNHQNSSFMIPV